MTRSHKPEGRKPRIPFLAWLGFFTVLAAGLWFGWLYRQIDQVGRIDDAHPSDAIAVFGAAQYVGRPSPVFHARLDHALSLYQRQIAPLIIVLGGSSDQNSTDTEGAAGRDYLLARGVPYDSILPETESTDTEQQAASLAAIARQRSLRSVVVVSDPSHLFRIAELCRAQGLIVHTSPRATYGTVSPFERRRRVLHEMLSYTAMRLHVEAELLSRRFQSAEDL